MLLNWLALPCHLIQLKKYLLITSKFLLLVFFLVKHRNTFGASSIIIGFNVDIKLIYTSFKIASLLSVKEAIPNGLHLQVVY